MREFQVYEDDRGQWVAECQELPGYRAAAKTPEEALAQLKAALLTFYPCKCED